MKTSGKRTTLYVANHMIKNFCSIL